jgi:hypothetical protein
MIPLAQDTIIGVWEPSFVANYNTKPYKSTQHQIDPKQENQKLPEYNTLVINLTKSSFSLRSTPLPITLAIAK